MALTDNQKWLYQQLTDRNINLGSEEQFAEALKGKDNLQWMYQQAKEQSMDIGDENQFFAAMSSQQSVPQTRQQHPTNFWQSIGAHDPYPQKTAEGVAQFEREQQLQRESAATMPISQQDKDRQAEIQRLQAGNGALGRMSVKASPVNQDEIDRLKAEQPSYITREIKTPQDLYTSVSEAWAANTPDGQKAKAELDKTAQDTYDNLMADMNRQIADLQQQVNNGTITQQQAQQEAQRIADNANAVYENEMQLAQDYFFRQMTDANADYLSQQTRLLGQKATNQTIADINARIAPHIRQLETERQQAMQRAGQSAQAQGGMYEAIGASMSANMAYKPEKDQELALYHQSQQFLADAAKISDAAQKGEGFWKGLGKSLGDIDTWDFGISQLTRSANLKDIVEKYEKGGQLTDAEKGLMDSAVAYMSACAYNSDKLNRRYKMGQTMGESIPFMLQFMVMPIGAIKDKVAKGVLGYGIEQFGGKAAQAAGKAAAKYGAKTAFKEAGTALLGNLAAAGVQTAAFGVPKIAEGAISRMTGDIQPDLDEQGNITYGGRQNQQGTAEAIWNSTVDMYAENLSEMILTSLDPLKAFAGTTKLFQGLKSSQIAQVLGKLNEGVIGKVRDRAQFRNYLEEVSEEYVGNLIRWGLSTDVHNAEDAGFSADQQIDTWLGLAPTSIAFVGAGAINNAVSGGIDRFQSSRAAKRLREIMQDGAQRQYLESLLRSRNSDDFSKNAHEVLKTILRDKELNEDTKRLIMDGIYSTYQSQLAQEAEQARIQAETEQQREQSEPITQGQQRAATNVSDSEQPTQSNLHEVTNVSEANLEGEEHYQDTDGNEVTFYRNADGSVTLRDKNGNADVDEQGNAVVLTQDEFRKYARDSNLRRVDRELSADQWAERENELRQQYAAEIQPNMHNDGNVYEVVLASDEDKRGYIVGDGRVEIDDTTDPAVPSITNADVVTVRYEDGTMAQVAAKDLNLVSVGSANDIVEQKLQPFQQYAQAMQTFHAGQEVTMDDGSGNTYTSHVVSVSEEGVEVEIENAQGEPDTTIIPNEIALTALHSVEQKQPKQQVEKQEQFEFVKTDPFGNPIVVEQPEQIPTTPQKIVPNIDTMLADELGASVVEYLGDKASAVAYLEAERDKADAEVKRLAKQKVTRYTDIADFKRQNDELQAAKKAAADRYNKLQNAIAIANNYKTQAEQAEEAARKAREEEKRAARRQTQIAQLSNTAPAERWQSAPKAEGNEVTRTLPDGTVIKGHYVLVEAGAATPSHDPFNGWNTSNGFPVTEDGKNINDRDYKNDTDAQQITTQIAQTYDGQAVAQVPVVSSEGIVYDGNGRTIAGNIAAANNTDGAYIQALADNAGNFGFAPEQVAGMQHPRVYMQTDEDLPYNTTTFAKFNAQEKKSQGSTNRAVSSSKKLTDAARDGMLRILDDYGTLDAFFASENGAKDIVRSLLDNGIITQQEVAGLTENTDRGFVLSPAGKDYVTDLLIGGLFDEQTIRMLGNDKGLKQSILRAMPSIVENRRLGDYALTDNINNAIRLLYEARQAGMAYPLYVKQGNAFDGYVSDRFSPFEMLLAEEMSSGVETFRQVLNLYNNSARDEANGQTGLFEPRTFDDIKKEILQHYGKSTDQSAATTAESTQSRPANTQTEPPVPSTPTGDGQGIASTEQANSATEESSRPNEQAWRSKANNRQKKSEKTPTGEQTEYNGSKEQSQSQQSENKIFTEDAYEAARRRMHERLNRLNAGLDPEMLSDGLIMAGYHVEKGARKFAEFAREMIREFGDKICPYLKSFYNGLRDLPEAAELSKEMDDYSTVMQFDVNSISIERAKETKKTSDILPSAGESVTLQPKKVDVEGLFGALNTKGEAKLSDHIEQESLSSANAEDTQPIGNVTQSKHTKTGEDIWIVKPSERVSDDEFKLLKARAKANNGYYSSFAKNRGFIFKSKEDANNFNNISDEETTTDQTSADTETAVRTAETVVGETATITRDRRDSNRAEGKPGTESIEGGVREPRNVELTPEQANEQVTTRQQAIDKIDKANDKITDQLAVLGFYEADTSDPTKLHESYGYIKTAEAKAVKDIDRLAKQLADDLGIKVSKRKTIAKANIAPAGGDISFRLPLENGKELYLTVDLRPNYELNEKPYRDVSEDSLTVDGIMWRIENPQKSGMARYPLGNQYSSKDAKYIDLLNDILRKSKEYLPTVPTGTTKQEIAKQVAEKATRKKKDTTRIADAQPMLDLFGDVTDTMNEGAQQEQDGWNTKLARFDEVEPINTNNNGNTEVRTDGRGENDTAQTEPTRQSRDENGTLGGSEQPQDERPVGRRVDTGSKPHRVHDGERSAGTPVQPTEQTVTQSEQTDIEPSQWRNTHNFHARGGERLAPTAPKARYEANLAAIRLLKQLQDEGRQATAQEKDILAQYSGWGGLGEFFKGEPGTTYYSQQGEQSPYQVLQSLLTDEELQAAQLSRNSAYYTPESVINSMWQVAERLGFKGGNILEGSAGIGNIFALMPSDISHRSNLTAVEIDDITAGILSQLYPDATTYHAGFQDVDIPNNSQDLVITNVPFVTGLHVYDKQEKDLSKRFGNIHDFCIAKNVRKLKQGGLGIFISSSGTLDNSKDLRVWLNNEGDADVIGAFRLNRETFGGTSATSDIIVVRKRVNGQKDPRSIDVLDTATDRIAKQPQDEVFDKYTNQFKKPADKEIKLVYNKYFVEHPLSMGGEMGFGFEHGDTRWGGTTAGCYPEPTINQSARLKDWIDSIEQSEQLPTYDELKQGAQVPDGTYETYEGAVPYGSLILNSKGEICKAYHGTAVPVEGINSNKVKGYSKSQVLKDYNAIKQAIDNLLQAQTKNVSDSELKPYLQQLNKVYDDFVRKYGNLNRNTSLAFLRNDVQWASVAAIEKVKETVDVNGKKKIQVAKTDLFSKRVVGVQAVPKAENTRDGIILSMQQFGTIRPDKIAEWLGKPTDEVEREIIGTRLGFRDPQTGNIQVRYEYLSGNVREKLAYAMEHNENGSLDANIEELRKVIPIDIPAHLIEFNIGSTWIPKELYLQYAKEKYDLDNLKLNHVGSAWVSNDVWGRNEKNRSEGVYSDMLGIQIYGHELMLAAMNNVPVVVSRVEKHSDGTSETRTDKVASAACSDKISQIKDDFVDWARGKMQQDSELADRIQKIYNDRFNAIVPMLKVDKEFLSEHLPGQNSAKYTLYPHQQQAVARGLTQALMLAHEVGTGKTISLISTAMEMRRLGTAKKPMIVVQNATTQQFVADAKDLYPNAKILTVSDRDRTAEGRQEFYAKIKYNDWDLIIVPQSVFDMIPDSEARMRDFINEKIEEKMHAIEAAKEAGLDNNVTKRMERELGMLQEDLETNNMSGKRSGKKAKEKDAKKEAEQRANTEARAQAMLDRKTDEIENFDEMGIDALLIDEAHNYKHLGFATMMTRGVKGVDPSYSKRAAALYLKCQSIYERNGHKNVIFATGTPISNTAAEIWTFMKYLMPKQTLQENEIYYFDDFVHNFGKINEQLEFATNGKFKANNRFAQYGNVPELMRLWLSVADCTLTREVGQVNDKVPELEGGKAQDIFLPQSPSLIDIMSAVRSQLEMFEKMSGKEKRENSYIPLTMYGIAKRAAIDPRLVDANAVDEPLSKTNRAVEEILRSLNDSKKYKGTVAIFCDSYQNKQSGFNLFNDIKEKLTKQDVSSNQIAIIRSEMSDSAKQKIFDAVREGDIRVIMGSTQTLGTGVNIQTRLYTLIHMDAPDRPMDYTQRNGRILRQGNMHKEWGVPVRVLRFGVEDSLDVTSYQRLKTKAGFIDSVMNGKSMIENNLENRVLEDVDEGIFDNPVAMLSGSQYALLKSQAERDLRKWSARAQQYRIDQILIAKRTKDNEKIIAYRKNKIADNEKLIELLSQTFPDGKVSEYNINGTVCHTTEEVKNALKDVNNKINIESAILRQDVYGGKKALSYPITLNGVPFNVDVQLTRKVNYKDGQSIVSIEKEVLYSAPTLGIEPIASSTKVIDRLIDMIQDDIISGKQARNENAYSADYIKRLEKENALMREREGKPFEHQAELEKAQTLVDEYTKKMQAELAEKEAKYANQSHNSVNLDKMDSEDDATDTAEAQYDELDYDTDNLTDAQQLATDAVLGALDNAGISVERVSEEEAEREVTAQKKSLDDTATWSELMVRANKAADITSNDNAKVLQKIETTKQKIANQSGKNIKNIVGVIADAAELSQRGSSHYGTFKATNGDVFTIRVSNHNATVSNFDNENETDGVSIVISNKPNTGINNDGSAHIVEYFYRKADLLKSYGNPIADILGAMKTLIESGEYTDPTGLAQRQEINIPAEPLRTSNGTIYGYAKDGKIYLTEKGFNPNTTIHEYTHLWVKAVRNNNSELYSNLRDLFSRENLPDMWDELDNAPQYRDLSDEAKLSEIIARFSSKRGAERMEQEAQKRIDEAKQQGKRAVADAVSFRERMRNLLRRFWNWVGEHLFHIKHFGSSKEAADRILYDLLNGTDLGQTHTENDSQAEFSTSPMPKRIEGEMVHEWARRIAEWKRQQVDEQQVAEYAKLLKQNGSKKSQAFAQLVDKFTPIDNFQQWVQAQGGVYDEDTMDMHGDLSMALGRTDTFSRRYKKDYMQRIADSITPIAEDADIADPLLALDLKWRDFDNKKMNGKPLTVREIMGVYAQAKDTWEAEQQGLSDRGAQGFVKNLGASHTDIIEAVERIIPQKQLDEFWNAVYAANQFALDYQLNAGMIDPYTRNRYTRRYYVPQRGWRERDFDGIDSAYVKDNGTRLYGNPYNAALVKARGRESLASDPFALIESIGLTSIIQSEHNKSKQQLLNLLLANEMLGLKSGAWRVKQVWSKNVIDPRTGHIMRKPDGTPVQAEVTYAAPTQQEREHDADINARIDQLRKELRDLTQPAARAKRENEITDLQDQLIYTGRATDTMLEHRTRDERMQHQVVVLKDGQQYIIELQDARLANAVNGNFGEAWKAYTMFNKLNAPAIRYVSGMLTQYNPRFAHRNFWRDAQAAFLNNLSEQGLAFTTRAMANIPAVQRTVWQYILADTYKNKESYGGQFGDYLREYFEAGAQTGFSFMPELERMAKDFDKMVKGENAWDKVWGKGVKGTLSLMTEASELTVRFAEYVTARQMGRSVQAAAKMAKNISVNFNQSGLMSKEMSKFFTFFNATIQGNMRFLTPYGKNKPKFGERALKFGAKFAGTAANFALLGFVGTWFQPDDPDDDTWFTEYDRMSNFILFGKVKIPVVHFFRMYYAAGVQAALAAQGRKTWKDAFYASTDYALGELIPTSMLQIQNFWDYDETTNTLEFNPAKYAQAAAPSVISPLVDVAVNRDFKGATVYRKKWDEDKKDITTAKRNTPQWAVDVSNTLHRWSGGNPDVPYKGGNTDGWIDIKPNAIEHVAQGYFSGVWESLGHTAGFIWDGAHDTDVYKHATNWPFLRDLFRDYSEDKAYNQQYYSVLQKLEKYEKRVNSLPQDEFYAEEQSNRFRTFEQVADQLRSLPNPYNDEETTVTSDDVNKILQLDIQLNRNLFDN